MLRELRITPELKGAGMPPGPVHGLRAARGAMGVGITNTAKHTNTRIYRDEGEERKEEEEEVSGASMKDVYFKRL